MEHVTDTDRFLSWFAAHDYSVTLAQIGDSQWFAEYRKHLCLLKKPPYNLPIERELFRKEPGRNHYFMKPILASKSDGEVTKPQVSPTADGKAQGTPTLRTEVLHDASRVSRTDTPTPSARYQQIELFGRAA